MSNPTYDAAIAAELSTLTREVDVPTGQLGYGTDLSCVLDVTPTLDEVDPMSRVAVAQAVIRSLITPRGAVLDAPDYGLDLRGMLNRGLTNTEIRALADQCRAEARKDDRVEDATVTMTYTDSTKTMDVRVVLQCVDPVLGTFDFVFAVTADGAALIESIR